MESTLETVTEPTMEPTVDATMEPKTEHLLQALQALQAEVKELRLFAERQQDSITSMIALSQQQSSIIEQQNALIQRLAVPGGTAVSGNSFMQG